MCKITPEFLEEQADIFINIVDRLNSVKKTLIEDGISCPTSLANDPKIYAQLRNHAFEIYEYYRTTFIKNSQEYANYRARWAHTERTMQKGDLIGFDKISPQDAWDTDFDPNNPNSAINKISNAIKQKLQEIPALDELIKKKTGTNYKEPLRQLTDKDFNHLPVNNAIKNSYESILKNIAGLLGLIGIKKPQAREDFFFIVLRLFNVDRTKFDSVMDDFEKHKKISYSKYGTYILVKEESYFSNCVRDFIETNDLSSIIQVIREKNE